MSDKSLSSSDDHRSQVEKTVDVKDDGVTNVKEAMPGNDGVSNTEKTPADTLVLCDKLLDTNLDSDATGKSIADKNSLSSLDDDRSLEKFVSVKDEASGSTVEEVESHKSVISMLEEDEISQSTEKTPVSPGSSIDTLDNSSVEESNLDAVLMSFYAEEGEGEPVDLDIPGSNLDAVLMSFYTEEGEGEPVDLGIPGYYDFRVIVDGPTRRVYKAKEIITHQDVAIKIIDTENNEFSDRLIRELLQKDLKHKNIVMLKSVFLFEGSLCLVMEHVPIDLEAHMTLAAPSPKHFLKQILEGLSFLHKNGIFHRDLKPANILVDDSDKHNPVVKIADFGLSRLFLDENIAISPHVGAWGYKAPEIVLGSQHYSLPADVWAVGCVFVDMVRCDDINMSNPLFWATSHQDELMVIFRILEIPTEATWPGISKLPNYEALTLFEHKLPSGLATHVPGLDPIGLDLLSKMLCVCPENRITAAAALEHEYFSTP